MYNSFIVGVVDTGDNTSPELLLPAIVVVTSDKLIVSDNENDENLGQCIIKGNNVSRR